MRIHISDLIREAENARPVVERQEGSGLEMQDKRIEELVEQKAKHLWEFMGVAEHLWTEWESLPDDEKQTWRDEVKELIKDLALIDRELKECTMCRGIGSYHVSLYKGKTEKYNCPRCSGTGKEETHSIIPLADAFKEADNG